MWMCITQIGAYEKWLDQIGEKTLEMPVHRFHASLSLHQGVKPVDPCTNKNFQFQEMVHAGSKELTNLITSIS